MRSFVFFAVLCAGLAAGETLDPAQKNFAQQVLAELKKLEPNAKLKLAEGAFAIDFESGEYVGQISLSNYYAEAKQAGSSSTEVAARIHRGQPGGQVLGVLPALRERVTVEVEGNLKFHLAPPLKDKKGKALPEDSIVYQNVGPELALVLVEDRPESMQWVSRQGLAEKKTTFDALLAEATKALAKRPAPKKTALGPGAWRFDGDEYAGAQFLLGEWVKTVNVKGAPVAVFTFRETVLVTGEDDAAGLNAVLETANAGRDKPRAWVPRWMRWTGSAWEEFAPKSPSPALRDALLYGRVNDYEEQTALLHQHSDPLPDGPKSKDEDLFPAKVMVVRSKGGGPLLLAALTQGEGTLLPEVKYIDLVLWVDDRARHAGVVTFDKLKATMGKRIVKTSLWPTRWKVTTFPTEAEMKTLAPSLELPE